MFMIPYSKQSIKDVDLEAVSEVLKSPWLTQGPKVSEFEAHLSKTLRVKEAIACSSGTAALQLAYASLGVNSDSIGIVPSVTFAATANAFKYLGAKVLFCDVNPDDGIISLSSLEEMLIHARKNCKLNIGVISAVSLAGKSAPLAKINQLAKKYDFLLVEDASHSPGAYLESDNGQKTYSASCEWTDAATVSFHPVKHICCGEGGVMLTNSSDLSKRAERLRSHGITRDTDQSKERPWYYEQVELGWNFRLTDIQAALGIEQVKRLDSSIQKRHSIAQKYDTAFAESKFCGKIDCPPLLEGHAWHLYVIRFRESALRDQAYHFLKERGITTQVHYIPLYRHPYHVGHHKEEDFPGAEAYFSSCLSIPMHPALSSTEQEEVIKALGDFLH
jgi:UDP-4-amino-4,6-dideoxy-N-acetyl-beta-L-altrosamine transaminase